MSEISCSVSSRVFDLAQKIVEIGCRRSNSINDFAQSVKPSVSGWREDCQVRDPSLLNDRSSSDQLAMM